MNPSRALTLLVADDDVAIRRIFSEVVGPREGIEVHEAATGEDALQLLRLRPFDLAFIDVRMPDIGGTDLMKRGKEVRPGVEFVIVTAYGTIESAVEAMKCGAADYLAKPFKLDQVSLLLERFRKVKALQSENFQLRQELQERYRARNLVGVSASMQRCYELVDRVRREECNVLLLGESGTGKELLARAIHFDGPRSDRLFVPIDCGAIQPSLLESELFGHEKGAFTGAHARRAGLFEIASGGTALLDEIGEFPLELQPVLLRALEEKKIRPVGATSYKAVDVRIIAATNRPLEEMVEAGEFRRDLFYRLNVVTIRIPPLRERPEDIPLLVEHFIRRYAERGTRKVTGIAPDTLDVLRGYAWPGNVRELEHAVEHACALGKDETLRACDFPSSVVPGAGLLATTTALTSRSLREMEVDAIRRLMREHRGDTAAVARILAIDRSTLYRKLKRYRLGESL